MPIYPLKHYPASVNCKLANYICHYMMCLDKIDKVTYITQQLHKLGAVFEILTDSFDVFNVVYAIAMPT